MKWIVNSWISVGEDRKKDILNWIEFVEYEEEKFDVKFLIDLGIDLIYEEL